MTVEQKARELLERMGVEGAQQFSSGELVELANLINKSSQVKTTRWVMSSAMISIVKKEVSRQLDNKTCTANPSDLEMLELIDSFINDCKIIPCSPFGYSMDEMEETLHRRTLIKLKVGILSRMAGVKVDS